MGAKVNFSTLILTLRDERRPSNMAWNASGVVRTIRCQGPLPLPGVGSGAGTRLHARVGGDPLEVSGGEWPNVGLTTTPVPFLVDFDAGE